MVRPTGSDSIISTCSRATTPARATSWRCTSWPRPSRSACTTPRRERRAARRSTARGGERRRAHRSADGVCEQRAPCAAACGAHTPAGTRAAAAGRRRIDPRCRAAPGAAQRPRQSALLRRVGRRYFVLTAADGYLERGVASWYGPTFHGGNTSSGEPYDMYGMTAAHKTLPLPTYARVTNLRNGRSVVVRINDRGPFVANRLIDLSYTAAAKLDLVRDGTTLVEVRALTPGVPDQFTRSAQSPQSLMRTTTLRPLRRLVSRAWVGGGWGWWGVR